MMLLIIVALSDEEQIGLIICLLDANFINKDISLKIMDAKR